MESETPVFLYDYVLLELRGQEQHPLTAYSSNAAPPQINSTIDLGGLDKELQHKRYRILAVDAIPLRTDADRRETSSLTTITLVVAVE